MCYSFYNPNPIIFYHKNNFLTLDWPNHENIIEKKISKQVLLHLNLNKTKNDIKKISMNIQNDFKPKISFTKMFNLFLNYKYSNQDNFEASKVF